MPNYRQIPAENPVTAPFSPDYPAYSRCPHCSRQMSLSRGHYYDCRDAATCGYSVSAIRHIPQLTAEALAIGEQIREAA